MKMAITNSSLKWAKYLRLAQFGFMTVGDLERDIRRYTRSQRQRVIADIALRLRAAERRNDRDLFVVKLVTSNLPGRLPNFRIDKPADIALLPAFFEEYEAHPYSEVWFCQTRVDAGVFSVAGRFVFDHQSNCRAQTVEQLWRCSPRLLENYFKGLEYPYIRASRYGWGWRYSIEDIHIPKTWEQGESVLIREFERSMQLVEIERERIEIFLAFLDRFGFRAYSIEYKIVGSTLTVIDWDTPNDMMVLLG
jgi:hypothetical protein